MAQDSFTYFRPEPNNLRAEYGGDAILSHADTCEITPATLTARHILNTLNLPNNYTSDLFKCDSDVSGVYWIRVPTDFYNAIYSNLTTYEKLVADGGTGTTTMPAGFDPSDTPIEDGVRGYGYNVIIRGDSISAGLGTTSGDKTEVCFYTAINLIAGETLVTLDSSDISNFASKNYKLLNISIGGSSWGNTVVQGTGVNKEHLYPRREDLAFNQRTRTMNLNPRASSNVFVYWLGTNDINYDSSQTGASVWTRLTTRIEAFREQFEDVKLMLCTVVKRSESNTLNNKINDFNVLMRANYASIGVDAIADFEALVPQVNISTGDTTNTTYYTDGTHLTTATHSLLAPVFKDALLSIT
jgi:lysophospholipase L1-like esterase